MKRNVDSLTGDALSAKQIEANFADLHPALTQVQALQESARCLYCYDAPCIRACPTEIDIPTFIHQIRTQNLAGSGQTILAANILGGTCARACPTEVLCEGACVVLGSEGKAVQIGALQRHAVDHVMQSVASRKTAHPFARAPLSGKKCAVIGAGPAGLSFAHRMAMHGHDVTIFEARAKAGGLNEYGLAAYKMVDDFAQAEVDFLMGIGGIELQNSRRLGDNLFMRDLVGTFDVIFLGTGLARAARLGIAGETLEGVEDAIQFIARLRQQKEKSTLHRGRNLVVIGGGSTAIDAAVQARCLGVPQATIVYRKGPEEMSATAVEQALARAHGVAIRYWLQPDAIRAAPSGLSDTLCVDFRRTRKREGDNHQRIYETTQELVTLNADHVLLAVGQEFVDPGLENIVLDKGRIAVNAEFQTNVPGIYAGGDCVNIGRDLTVEAVAHGKLAAQSAHAFLSSGGRVHG